MPKRILVIEDDPDVRAVIADTLNNAGYETVTAETAMNGLATARDCRPDVIVLDLGLPDFDGSEVAPRLRRINENVPVIVLTARDNSEDKAKLLYNGADDYLTKPFEPRNLVARIDLQLRRPRYNVLKVGALEINLATRTAHWRNQPVTLNAREFELIAFLARHPGRIFTHQELVQHLWPDRERRSTTRSNDLSSLNVHAMNIRQRFEAVGAFRVLRTVRGVGIGLDADLERRAP